MASWPGSKKRPFSLNSKLPNSPTSWVEVLQLLGKSQRICFYADPPRFARQPGRVRPDLRRIVVIFVTLRPVVAC